MSTPPEISDPDPRRVETTIRTYLSLSGFYTLAASIIWAVNTLFLLDAGLSVLQVFITNSVFTGAMALFEIPTGVLADTRGRRTSFLLSIFVLIIGTLGYVAASMMPNSLPLFIIMSVILGLGYTFYSGAMEAWLVDALQAGGFDGELDEIFARGSIISGVAMLTGSLTGGFLGTIDLAFPFILRIILLGVVFGIAYRMMHDIGFEPKQAELSELPREMGLIAQASIRYGWQNRSVRLIILAGMVQSFFMAWGFYAWQPYFLELLERPEATWVAGVIAALISCATIAGNIIVERGLNRAGRRTNLLMASAVVLTLAMIGVGLTSSFYVAVGLYLIVTATMGVWGPVKQAYMHQLIPSEQRATVISFDSLMGSGSSVIGQNLLGQIAQQRSFGIGYVASGSISILVWPTIWLLRQRNDAFDFIEEEKDVGLHSACAAHGVPAVSGVNTQAGVAVSKSGD